MKLKIRTLIPILYVAGFIILVSCRNTLIKYPFIMGTIFRDDFSISVPDPDHSLEEERFITVGVSSQNRLLMVAHTERGDSIRIISARELTPRERGQYEEADWNG